MDKAKFSQLAAFVNDEKRFDAAFNNVIDGIESGRIRADEFPLAAAPLRAGGLNDNREFVARFLEQLAGLSLSPEERVVLDETIAALPAGAGIEELYTALDSAEPLAGFTAALRKANADPRHDPI